MRACFLLLVSCSVCHCVCVFAPRLRSVASLIKSRRVLQNMYLVFFPSVLHY